MVGQRPDEAPQAHEGPDGPQRGAAASSKKQDAGPDKGQAASARVDSTTDHNARWDQLDADQQDNNDIVPLTRAEAEQLFGAQVSRPSRVTPFRVVAAQVVLSLVAALLWWLFYKPPGAAAPDAVALSALLGGAICWLPGALFAARLKQLSRAGTVMNWMLGEAFKMGATIAMFVAIAFWYRDVQWIPLLVTYLIVLKTYWIALAWR
ncbi:ATP synthase subunit I [Paraburkholderia sacchari]|uniref:ATP synthase subunit I n=1 Tax=Paraburkholderia sacchari TaxID=159450 RepID=A0A8T6Z8V9_9BURK|nr:ATP synthase subunit I [Paraburkholderia sacchari]NLP61033.1 ATP synthase subunit I [Paraburkholderia sacchari]